MGMNIRYIRNPNASHMIIDGKNRLLAWEQCMMRYNAIEGILFADCVCENGITSLWYDITGKQALDVMLESTKLDYERLYRIVNGIYHAVDKLTQLLLRTDALLLSPESIFVDHSTGEVWFCYYPGNEQLLTDAFGMLSEYLLTRVDHKDEDAVMLIYGLYEQTREENFSFFQLQRELKTPYPREEAVCGSLQGVESEYKACESIDQKAEENNAEENKEENIVTESSAAVFLNRTGIFCILRKIFLFPEKKESVQRKKLSILCGLTEKICRDKGKGKDYLTEPFVFEPEKESVLEAHPTVLLSDLPKKQTGILKYAGENGYNDMVISADPFLIGSDSSCEGFLPSETVSRRHAKITKQEDMYFIEDLNSSNGTSVGGELLSCRVKMGLHGGEVILFADEKFIFS